MGRKQTTVILVSLICVILSFFIWRWACSPVENLEDAPKYNPDDLGVPSVNERVDSAMPLASDDANITEADQVGFVHEPVAFQSAGLATYDSNTSGSCPGGLAPLNNGSCVGLVERMRGRERMTEAEVEVLKQELIAREQAAQQIALAQHLKMQEVRKQAENQLLLAQNSQVSPGQQPVYNMQTGEMTGTTSAVVASKDPPKDSIVSNQLSIDQQCLVRGYVKKSDGLVSENRMMPQSNTVSENRMMPQSNTVSENRMMPQSNTVPVQAKAKGFFSRLFGKKTEGLIDFVSNNTAPSRTLSPEELAKINEEARLRGLENGDFGNPGNDMLGDKNQCDDGTDRVNGVCFAPKQTEPEYNFNKGDFSVSKNIGSYYDAPSMCNDQSQIGFNTDQCYANIKGATDQLAFHPTPYEPDSFRLAQWNVCDDEHEVIDQITTCSQKSESRDLARFVATMADPNKHLIDKLFP
jgi:hypothetical protein